MCALPSEKDADCCLQLTDCESRISESETRPCPEPPWRDRSIDGAGMPLQRRDEIILGTAMKGDLERPSSAAREDIKIAIGTWNNAPATAQGASQASPFASVAYEFSMDPQPHGPFDQAP